MALVTAFLLAVLEIYFSKLVLKIVWHVTDFRLIESFQLQG